MTDPLDDPQLLQADDDAPAPRPALLAACPGCAGRGVRDRLTLNPGIGQRLLTVPCELCGWVREYYLQRARD